jgi:anti-anti-sigma factor
MPGVELKTSVRDGRVVVALRGDLDVTGAADADAAIMAQVARGQSLIIDMSALDFMDCASLGALLGVQGLARRGGGDVVLAAPQPQVRRLLALTAKMRCSGFRAAWRLPLRVLPAAGGGIVGGGLRCALHAQGRAAPSRTGAG